MWLCLCQAIQVQPKKKKPWRKKKRRSGGKQRRCYRSIQVFWTRACKGTSTEGNDQPRRECSSITSINLGVLARSYMEMHLSDLWKESWCIFTKIFILGWGGGRVKRKVAALQTATPCYLGALVKQSIADTGCPTWLPLQSRYPRNPNNIAIVRLQEKDLPTDREHFLSLFQEDRLSG